MSSVCDAEGNRLIASAFAEILEDAENGLSGTSRDLFKQVV